MTGTVWCFSHVNLILTRVTCDILYRIIVFILVEIIIIANINIVHTMCHLHISAGKNMNS